MNNAPMNLDSIRQPTPNIVGGNDASLNQNSAKKTFNFPNVGVVDVPTISKTPLADTLVLKEQQNPRTIFKFTPKSNRGFDMQNTFSLAIVGCAIVALLNLLKKK